jgi:LEA14-like dessication related protein
MLDTRPLPILQIAAGAWLLAAAGCASSPDFQAVKARERAVTAEGSEIEVTVELRNPNDAPVELTTWDYSVIVNDKTAYTGQWVASLTLPPNDRMLAELPAFVPASFGDITGQNGVSAGN